MSTKTVDWTGHTLEGRNGQYQIRTALGSGGMATVYLAIDVRTGKEVAVKLPHEQILREEGFAARFTREVKSLLKLAHPNIVKVIDVGDFRGAPFAVLQYLALGSLRLQQPLDLGDGKIWPMRPDEMIGWLTPVADALDFVHRKGYVHRDVKPENIMFDSEGNPYLGDFGVIKARADVHKDKPETVATGAGLVLGTPHYMAPEVLMGETYDGRADQYSLAVTVYELLAARVPFPGDAPVAIVGHTTRPVPRLTTIIRDMPSKIDQVVLMGLAKRKEDRYRDCRAFADAFAAAVRATMPAVPIGAGATSAPSGRSATPPPIPVPRSAVPPPVPRTPASGQPIQPPTASRRTAPILCPYCRYEVNLPEHVRSKAIRCAGCRKVYLLDAPSSDAGTVRQEQARVDTRPEERRVPPPDVRTPRPQPIEPRREEPRRAEREPRRPTPPSIRSKPPVPPAPPAKPPKPPKPPKPKGPPLWKQPGFRKLVRLSTKVFLVVALLGAGGYGILFGYNWYQARIAKDDAKLSDKACDEGRYADAMKYAESAIDKDSACAPGYVSRGRVKYFQGDLEGALDDLNKAVDLDPNQPAAALAYRSAVQLSRGLIEDALADAKAATAADPNLGVAHSYLGLAKLESGAKDGEISCDQGCQKSPDSPEAFRIRAFVRKANGKSEQADSDMETAVNNSGKAAFYVANRGLYYILPGIRPDTFDIFDASNLNGTGGNLVRAKADGDEAIKKDPTCGLGDLSISVYHLRNGNSSEALKWAQSAISASPKLVAGYEVAHWILFVRLGNKSEGLAMLDKGLNEVPTSPRLHMLRGQARRDQSDYTGAIADFTDLIRLAPNEPEPYRLRAACYSRSGKGDLAADDYKKADARQRDWAAGGKPLK